MKSNAFGQKLKELRIEKGFSQRELGEKLGFCNQTISFWESGSREPDLDTLVEIARFFDVAIEELLEDK
jgi:transcriptional regulator with XRE-family HTH domain